VTLGLKQPLT